MKVLNLNGIYFENEIKIKTRFYPWGEPSINLNDFLNVEEIKNNSVNISTRITNSSDFLSLIALLSSLKQINVFVQNLFIPYFPWCRQDRIELWMPFSIEMYRDILNWYKIWTIITLDIHSLESYNILNKSFNIKNISNFDIWKEVVIEEQSKWNKVIIVWPDKWCKDRLQEYKEKLWIEVYYWNKVRKNWIVTSLSIDLPKNIGEGYKIIVIDDICDWWTSAIELAKIINSKNKELYVTHWIYSKGTEELSKYYNKLITTESFVKENKDIFYNKFNLYF